MNKKDKKQWLIRYAKNNNIEDILDGKYKIKKDKHSFAHISEDGIQMMEVSIHNYGMQTKHTSCTLISFFDVTSNENYRGAVPIRYYSLPINEHAKLGMSWTSENEYDTANEINKQGYEESEEYTLLLRSSTDPLIRNLAKEFVQIPAQFSNNGWGITFNYLIILNYYDIYDEIQTVYF